MAAICVTPVRRALSQDCGVGRVRTFEEAFGEEEVQMGDELRSASQHPPRRARYLDDIEEEPILPPAPCDDEPEPQAHAEPQAQLEDNAMVQLINAPYEEPAPAPEPEPAVQAQHVMAHQPQMVPVVPHVRDVRDVTQAPKEYCLYIDRISPDVSDGRIIAAIANEVEPRGVPKVVALEVIRTQKSRHVHAFAVLNMPLALEVPLEIPVQGGDYVKVQRATKPLQIPPTPAPCRTLHIRVYGVRTAPWMQAAVRMTWGGLLALLESVSQGIVSNISMVADDQSPRSNVAHPSVLLGVFFCECYTVEQAMMVRQAVHDQSTLGIDDNLFLIRADFAKGEKHLHDTSDNIQALQMRFDEAKNFALGVGQGDPMSWALCDSQCRIPREHQRPHRRGLCSSFTFGDRSEKKRRGGQAKHAAQRAKAAQHRKIAAETPAYPFSMPQ